MRQSFSRLSARSCRPPRAVRSGTVVCAGIQSEIPAFREILWGERRVVSVANLSAATEKIPRARAEGSVKYGETLPLELANEALARLREGRINGAQCW
jgi:propanol-preferring alcohol dehydrogenase